MIERALIAVLLLIASALGGFFYGKHVDGLEWQAKEAQRVQDERNRLDSERLRADKASGAFQAELLAQRIETDKLQGAFHAFQRAHRPLLARRANATPGAIASAATPDVPPGNDVHLSAGAVWMWNSALFQRDAPAGACGLADTTEESCSADSGIGLEEAVDNQAVNARICAEDRHRHRRLIDFINGGKK